MNDWKLWIAMSITGLFLMWRKFKNDKSGFNPFKKYSKRQLKMFKRSDELQEEEKKP